MQHNIVSRNKIKVCSLAKRMHRMATTGGYISPVQHDIFPCEDDRVKSCLIFVVQLPLKMQQNIGKYNYSGYALKPSFLSFAQF